MNRLSYLFIVLLFFSCSSKYNKVSEMKPGDIVSIVQGNDYCIAKVLDIDTSEGRNSVSIFLWKKRFPTRPDSSNFISLTNENNPETYGNISWEIQGFEGGKPQIFYFQRVKVEEVENDRFFQNLLKSVVDIVDESEKNKLPH